MRAYATANTAHSISNDNHNNLKRTSSIIISKTYTKSATFPTGDCSVFSMFLLLLLLVTKIIGVSGFRHKRRTRPFSVNEESAKLFLMTRYMLNNLEVYFIVVLSFFMFCIAFLLGILKKQAIQKKKIMFQNVLGMNSIPLQYFLGMQVLFHYFLFLLCLYFDFIILFHLICTYLCICIFIYLFIH